MPCVDDGITRYPGWQKYDARYDPFIGYSYEPNEAGQRKAIAAYTAKFGMPPEQMSYSLGLWRCWPGLRGAAGTVKGEGDA